MHFCTNCGNMYYIRLDEEETKLIYYCRKCGQEDTKIGTETIIVSKTMVHNNKISRNNIINQYTKLDPTIPHIHSILCVNSKCPSNDESSDLKSDILYIRYNTNDLKYVYLCYHCDTKWSNDIN